MAKSRVETAMDNLITAFQAIVKGDTYRTSPAQVIRTIRHIDDIQQFPEIGIEFGAEQCDSDDSAFTIFDSIIAVTVQAAVQYPFDITNERSLEYTICEEMVHDLKRIVAGVIKTYVHNTTSAWLILPKRGITFYRLRNIARIDEESGQLIHKDKGVVGCTFYIKVRSQDATFA